MSEIHRVLRVDDGLSYHSIKDICNQCFGENYKGYQKGTYMINDYCMAWFPKLAYEKEGNLVAGSKTKDWINKVLDDGNIIEEYNKSVSSNEDDPQLKVYRLVFAKTGIDDYKFLGVYRTKSFCEIGVPYAKREYQRIALEVDLTMLGQPDFDELEKKFVLNAEKLIDLSETEKMALVKSRIGQSKFKEKLMEKYGEKCAICSMKYKELLVASHVKEWSESAPQERMDTENGLLLCTVHDSVFDKHLISFDEQGKMIISPKLEQKEREVFHLTGDYSIIMSAKMKEYMKYHRKKFDEKSSAGGNS